MGTRFVVIFVGRSGSSFLMDLLRSHPNITARGEVFTQPERRIWSQQERWLRKFYASCGSGAAVGFKTKLPDVGSLPDFEPVLAELEVNVIALLRRNVVAQAISWCAAEALFSQQGIWNVTDSKQRTPPIRIDPSLLRTRIALLDEATASLNAFATKVGCALRIDYEDLCSQQDVILSEVLKVLKVEPFQLRSNLIRNIPYGLRAIITNFDEVTDCLDEPRLLSMLNE